MTGTKQIEANRRNAEKSTGPTSAKGKKGVAGNAVKHGLTARRRFLLPDEDEKDFEDLQDRVWQELRPESVLEEEVVRRIVDLLWRLRRVGLIETGVLTFSFFEGLRRRADDKISALQKRGPVWGETAEEFKLVEASHDKAIAKLDKEASMLGRAFAEDAASRNALMKLARYESTLSSQLTKARHELDALQLKRVHTTDYEVEPMAEIITSN